MEKLELYRRISAESDQQHALNLSSSMQIIFKFLILRELINLQALNKRSYRRYVPQTMPERLHLDDLFDVSVLERIRCGTRILLFGAEAKQLMAMSLATNYSQKVMECNFDYGMTYFSLFKTEGYGVKMARINAHRIIIMAQNHAALLDFRRLQKIELLADCPLRSDSAAYTNIVYMLEPSTGKQCIYRTNVHKKRLVILRYDIEEDEWSQVAESEPLKKNAN